MTEPVDEILLIQHRIDELTGRLADLSTERRGNPTSEALGVRFSNTRRTLVELFLDNSQEVTDYDRLGLPAIGSRGSLSRARATKLIGLAYEYIDPLLKREQASLRRVQARKAPMFATKVTSEAIVSALNRFTDCLRYLKTRTASGVTISLKEEADVQDVIYFMLRPWLGVDLVPEHPTRKVASRFAKEDFLIVSAHTVVETKFIRDRPHGRKVSEELHDDIEIYRQDDQCENLIFFIYDEHSMIPDVEALRKSIETKRSYGDKSLVCHVIVVR